MMHLDELKVGDIILFSALEDDPLSQVIAQLTDTNISHSALCYDHENLVEEMDEGIQKNVLVTGVVTNSLKRGHRVIGQIEAGICWINTWGESDAKMPVGGYKHSGVGRENGLQTLKHYTQTKSVQVEMGDFESVF